ncbi:MAG: peptidoglycan/xylan/chitin deacetylase (PgdA/CDA1 family) [Verrucomicrobiales bacterium]|jgi:peptidoglycan/xylan/chitin deacetylase (PgdA/CDA1 family)
MKAVTVSYHDAVTAGDFAASGFIDNGASIYKLDVDEMERQFESIKALHEVAPSVARAFGADADPTEKPPLFLAFDDGGSSAATLIAPLLEKHGWRGHFFITADRIGKAGFVDADQIRSLRDRGHVIGSHSWSHPTRMSECGREELLSEWGRSTELLGEILGEPVDVASVPGGYFSTPVARAAAASGIRFLFTSEPTKAAYDVDGCLVLGRYTLLRGMATETAADFAGSRLTAAQLKQALLWKVKKLVKKVGGSGYLAVRRRILAMKDRGEAHRK